MHSEPINEVGKVEAKNANSMKVKKCNYTNEWMKMGAVRKVLDLNKLASRWAR